MSRIGKQPIPIPAGVKVQIDDGLVSVEGPKGAKLQQSVHRNVKIEHDATGNRLVVHRLDDERQNRALHGLFRSLINNMIVGVTQGYTKRLKIEGVGYSARMDKKKLVLTVGFANPVVFEPADGLTVEVPDATTIVVKGADKQAVGQLAAEIRHTRPPEPYKGKGVRYEGEVVRRKEGKSFTSGG